MATVNRFEDLDIWKLSREICKEIHTIISRKPFSNDFNLINQIKRSSGSIMDNIAEGFERDGKQEFIQFLSYSKGSAGETRSQFFRALDSNYISTQEFELLQSKILTLSVKISNMIQYLKKSEHKGVKYKSETT